ncbi:MAG: hypothetical protein ACI8TE_000504 [Francisella sp.]
MTCRNAGGCDQIAFAALTGAAPIADATPAVQNDPGGVANNIQGIVGVDCVPKDQLSC